MKYGIKHNAGEIEAISTFASNVVPAGFIELTKAKYDEFVEALETNPFATYDDVKNEFSQDALALATLQEDLEKEVYRDQLRVLSIELDLMVRLGEDTVAKQAEFDALKLQYEGL